MYLTLTNSFHNTSARIQAKDWMVPQDQSLTWSYIDYRANTPYVHNHKAVKSLRNRVRRKLCGARGCTCGTVR